MYWRFFGIYGIYMGTGTVYSLKGRYSFLYVISMGHKKLLIPVGHVLYYYDYYDVSLDFIVSRSHCCFL